MSRSGLFFAAKLLFGLALLAVLLLRGDTWAETAAVLGGLDLAGLILVLAMPVPLIWASCLKWQLLLDYRGIRVTIPPLMRYYTVGYWFNNFLPSSLGGDAARSYLVGKRIGSQSESLAAVVLERLTGLVTLVALAILGFIATPRVQDDPVVVAALAIMAGGCLALSLIIWAPGPFQRIGTGSVTGSGLIGRLAGAAGRVRGAMQSFWGAPRVITLAAAYSFGYHALTIVNVYVASRALGIDVGFAGLCAVTPIILVLAALPTTPGSIGVWEWAYSVLLMPIGAELEQGLAIALVLRGQLLFTSLVGGVLYVAEKRPLAVAAQSDETHG
ncbi:lysylphosphatidylglycerol synthase transmembrane domain-containing protein [Marinibacterium sp. SX1]|uniref:lysylphosphatidylglycerol synthase transmembrane domain-containing protein n=1 Tax=Marinibacterium sp. SX1 TaxID=3388424 RepID=UPI003D16BDC7